MTPVLITLDPWRSDISERKSVYIGSAASPAALGIGGHNWQPNISTRPVLSLELMSPDLNGRVQAGTCRFAVELNGLVDQDGVSVQRDSIKWSGAPVEVFLPTDLKLGDAPEFRGRVSSVRTDLERGVISVTATVNTEFLDGNLLTEEFNGDNGAGGEPEVRGTLRPAGFGPKENIPPVWFDTERWIGQIDGYGNTISITKLMEGLADRGAAVGDYATYADLAAAIDNDIIPPGRWGTCVAEGLVGLGAPPEYPITVNATFGSDRIGALIQRVLTTHLGVAASDIDASAFTALDTAVDRQICYWTNAQRPAQDLIESLAASANATPIVRFDGKVSITRAVTSGSVLTLNRNGNTLPRVTQWESGAPRGLPWRIAARVARPATTLDVTDVLYADDIIDRGLYDAATVYRQGNLVSLSDKSTWLYTNVTADSGNALPTWPTTSNAHWQNLSPPLDATALGVEPGATNGADWDTNVTDIPANLAALSGTEGVDNSAITISSDGSLIGAGGGQVTADGLGIDTDGGWGSIMENIGAAATISSNSYERTDGAFGVQGIALSETRFRSGIVYAAFDFTQGLSQRTHLGFWRGDKAYTGTNANSSTDGIAVMSFDDFGNRILFTMNGASIAAPNSIKSVGATSGWAAIGFDGATIECYVNGVLEFTGEIDQAYEGMPLRSGIYTEFAGRQHVNKISVQPSQTSVLFDQIRGDGAPSAYATSNTRLLQFGSNIFASGSNIRLLTPNQNFNASNYARSPAFRGGIRGAFRVQSLASTMYMMLVSIAQPGNDAYAMRINATTGEVFLRGPGVSSYATTGGFVVADDVVELVYDGVNLIARKNGTELGRNSAMPADLDLAVRWTGNGSDLAPGWTFIECDWGPFTDQAWQTIGNAPPNVFALVGNELIDNTAITIGSDGTLSGGGGGQVSLPGLGGEAEADVTKSVTGTSAINFDFDSNGTVKVGQTGARGVVSIITSGGTLLTSGVSWAVTVLSGTYTGSNPTISGSGSGQLNFSSAPVTEGRIRVVGTTNGRSYTRDIDVTRTQDAPPTGGSGGSGGSTVTTGNASGSALTGGAWVTVYEGEVDTGSGVTAVDLMANSHSVWPTASGPSGSGSANVQYQWQRETSPGSNSWTDVGLVANSNPDPTIADFEGFPESFPGSISCTRADTGRAQNTTYSYRLRMRLSSSSGNLSSVQILNNSSVSLDGS